MPLSSPSDRPPAFPWTGHLWINLFWMGLNIRNNAVGALFLPFLVDQFVQESARNTSLGLLRTAGLIVAMLAQPAAGLLSDRSTSRFGRRRPFIFVGVLLDLLLLAAIALSWNFPTLLAAVLLFQVSSNISHGPLQGLIPDLVPIEQRGISSAVKSIFELLPLILVGAAVAPLVSAGQFPMAVAATGSALLLTMLVTVLWVKEPRYIPAVEGTQPVAAPMLRVLGMLAGIGLGGLAGLVAGAVLGGILGVLTAILAGPQAGQAAGIAAATLTAMLAASGVGVWSGVRAALGSTRGDPHLAARRPFSWWILNRLLFLAAITSIQGFAPFFLMDTFAIDREAAAGMTGGLMTMVGLFTLLTALPGGWLADRYGVLRVLTASGIAAAIGAFMLLGAIWSPAPALISAAGAVLGLATGLFMTANWALGTRLVPREQAGRYLGISNLAGAGAGMIGSGIGGPAADAVNALYPGMGYFVIFTCYGALFLASAISLLPVRRAARAAEMPAGQMPDTGAQGSPALQRPPTPPG
jgi:MFS family permease